MKSIKEKLFVGQPNITGRDTFCERINKILDRKYLSNGGPISLELEEAIRKYLRVRHCILVCNATIGLEIAIRALHLSGEVIVPSFTFLATANSLKWLGLKPVFCDVDLETHTLDTKLIRNLITKDTSAILPVHLWGRPSDISELEKLSKEFNLRLLFDAAHAFGNSYQGKKIGNFGNAEVFSFHATKFLNSGEGGAITTNDDILAERIKAMRSFGFKGGLEETITIGTNGKMNEFSAAMGLTNFENIDELIEKNRVNYRLYQKLIASIPGISLVRYDETEQCNYQYVVLIVDRTKGISRDNLMEVLHQENVMAKRYFYPGCHMLKPYCDEENFCSLQKTEQLADSLLALPTGTNVSLEDIEKICQIIRRAQETFIP